MAGRVREIFLSSTRWSEGGGREEGSTGVIFRMSYDLLSREGENEVGYGYERNVEDLIIFYLAELIEDVIYYLNGCDIHLPDSLLKRAVEAGLNSGRSSEEMAHLLHCVQSLGNNKGHCFECNHPKKKIRFTCSRCEAKFCNDYCMRYHFSSDDCVCDQIIIFRHLIEEQRNNGSTAETEERGEVCVGEGNV